MQSKRIKKLIIANVVLLAFLAAGFTYAWFASTYGNIVEADQVQVIADSALEISFDDQNWSSYLNLNAAGSPVDFNNLKFTDITGSGDGNFLKPTLNQFGGYAEVATGASDPAWTVPTANTDYIKFPLYIRSTDRVNVYLGEGASVSPQASTLLNLQSNDTANNKSAYGNFSRDLVAGAVRVSVVDNAATPSRQFTWIPCPEIYLNAGSNEAISSYQIFTDIASIADPRITNGVNPFKHYYYADNKATAMIQLTDNLITGKITNDNRKLLVSLTDKSESETYYKDMVTVYIWLEGCDNEARRAFVDGKFNVSLNISAVDATSTGT